LCAVATQRKAFNEWRIKAFLVPVIFLNSHFRMLTPINGQKKSLHHYFMLNEYSYKTICMNLQAFLNRGLLEAIKEILSYPSTKSAPIWTRWHHKGALHATSEPRFGPLDPTF